MGVFGHGPFDNDDALDWLGEPLDLEAVRAALQLELGFLELDVACEAYAAAGVLAAVVAGARGAVPARTFRALSKAFAAEPQTSRAALVAQGMAAAKRVTTSARSELRRRENARPLAAAGAKLVKGLAKAHARLACDPRRRPKGVAKGASFDAAGQVWVTAPRDARGRFHGEAQLWRADGTLQQRCEFVHGTPHGAFTRYHESGQVSRTGTLVRNRLEGVDTLSRSRTPSSERALWAPFDRRIWRLETEYRGGVQVSQRAYDARGRQVALTGGPLPPRPRTVPRDAVFSDDGWSAGELDRRGRPDGTWRSWDRRGRPRFRVVWEAGVEVSRTPAR